MLTPYSRSGSLHSAALLMPPRHTHALTDAAGAWHASHSSFTALRGSRPSLLSHIPHHPPPTTLAPAGLHLEDNRSIQLPLGPYLSGLVELVIDWPTLFSSHAVLAAATQLTKLYASGSHRSASQRGACICQLRERAV